MKDQYVHIQACIYGYDMGRTGHLGPWRHKSPAQGTLSCTQAASAHPPTPPVQAVWPVGQSFCHLTEPAGSRTCHGLCQCFPSKFLKVILNDIVAQATVSSCHVHRTLGGTHHTPLASETRRRAAHPSGDPLMLPTSCYRLGAVRPTGLSFFTLSDRRRPSLQMRTLSPEESSHSLYHLSMVE